VVDGAGHHSLVLHAAILVVRELVRAWSPLHLLASFDIVGIVMVHLWLHLVAIVPVVDEYAAHIGTYPSIAAKSRHHLLGLLHVQALHLDKVLHVLSVLLELSFDLLQRGPLHVGLLHLKLHVVKDTIEIDWVEFDGHFDGWILLEVHERSLSLLRVQHTCGSLDPLSFIVGDLFAVEDHKLNQALDYDHSVVLLACNRVVNQRQVQ